MRIAGDHTYPLLRYSEQKVSVKLSPFVATNYSTEFRLITSEGLTVRGAPFAAFSMPFKAKVWCALAINLALVSILLAKLSDSGLSEALPWGVLTLAGSLLDQSPQSRRSEFSERNRLANRLISYCMPGSLQFSC